MANRETSLMREIRVAVNSEPGCRCWRNDVGKGTIERDGGRKQFVQYGLALGSADLVGIAHGRFLSLEVKTPAGRASEDQRCWYSIVSKLGGVAAYVRSVDEALAVVRGAA